MEAKIRKPRTAKATKTVKRLKKEATESSIEIVREALDKVKDTDAYKDFLDFAEEEAREYEKDVLKGKVTFSVMVGLIVGQAITILLFVMGIL